MFCHHNSSGYERSNNNANAVRNCFKLLKVASIKLARNCLLTCSCSRLIKISFNLVLYLLCFGLEIVQQSLAICRFLKEVIKMNMPIISFYRDTIDIFILSYISANKRTIFINSFQQMSQTLCLYISSISFRAYHKSSICLPVFSVIHETLHKYFLRRGTYSRKEGFLKNMHSAPGLIRKDRWFCKMRFFIIMQYATTHN